MSDIFQIVHRSSTKPKGSKLKNEVVSKYNTLQSNFLTHSYGYYTPLFLQRISMQANQNNPQTEAQSVGSILRSIVRRFFLSDLELIFLGHISKCLAWNFTKTFYRQNYFRFKQSTENFNTNQDILNFYLHLIAYFVKSYIGQIEQAVAITDFISLETGGQWECVFQEWIKLLPEEVFNFSPRTINTLYSSYARDCQKGSRVKNFNSMVDRILELSTTYSMIPGEIKQQKRRPLNFEEEEAIQGRKKRNIITEGFMSNTSRRFDSSVHEPFFQQSKGFSALLEGNISRKQSKLEKKEIDAIGETVDRKEPKKLLRLKTRNQQITNHVTEFYQQKQFDNIVRRQQYRPESTVGIHDSMINFLGFNRPSTDQPIPYPPNLSNLSNFSNL